MNDLPRGWSRITLGDAAVSVKNGIFISRPGTDPDGVPILRISSIRPGALDLSDVRYSGLEPTALSNADSLVLPGDLLFTRYNGNIDYVGACALVPTGVGPLTYPDKIIRVRVDKRMVDPAFVCYAFVSPEVRALVRGLARTTAGQAGISGSSLRKISFPLPPLAEQRRIVAALEDHLSRVEFAMAVLHQLSSRVARLRERVIDSAALGSLGPAHRGTDRASALSGLNGRSGLKIDYSALPALPIGWTWRQAADLCDSISCGSTPASNLMYAESGQVPFLKVYNLTKLGTVDFSIRPTFIDRSTHEGPLRRSRVRPGDVLTNIVGPPLGKTVVVPDTYSEWNINQAIVAFRSGAEISADWLALVLQAPTILKLLQGTARATAGQFNIALSTCRELPLPVPPRDEQARIIARTAEILSNLDVAHAYISKGTRYGARLRQSLMSDALAGRLVEQDPYDEPVEQWPAKTSTQRNYPRPSKKGRVAGAPKHTSDIASDAYEQEELPL